MFAQVWGCDETRDMGDSSDGVYYYYNVVSVGLIKVTVTTSRGIV